ncbi:MAG: hypothetical protein AB1765_02775 [Candidatus Hydrogenedentota bacterium]
MRIIIDYKKLNYKIIEGTKFFYMGFMSVVCALHYWVLGFLRFCALHKG